MSKLLKKRSPDKLIVTSVRLSKFKRRLVKKYAARDDRTFTAQMRIIVDYWLKEQTRDDWK
jgi:hypothetical protein